MALYIRKSVGLGGVNGREDVKALQAALNLAGAAPALIEDGLCGPRTVAAIGDFQSRFMADPDRRADPGGRTVRELNALTREPPAPARPATTATWEWEGDSSRWPQEKKLASLSPEFRPLAEGMLDELRSLEFQPFVVYGWRSVAVQAQLLRQGKTTVSFSFHNAQLPDSTPNALAVDVIDKRWGWGAGAEANGFWEALGEAARARNLIWGGDWANFRDLAHVQLYSNGQLKRIRRESCVA